MNTNWDSVMCVIRTIDKKEYKVVERHNEDFLIAKKKYEDLWVPTTLHDHNKNCLTYRENFIIRSMAMWGHKEKKEYLKMNKIKGYSKCTNHQQLNKLMMSF
jgi:hypothetical protein